MEVRRCAGCGAAAMVCVSTYERARIPLGGDITDWVCQRCGRPITLHTIPWIWVPVALLCLPLLPLALGIVGFALRDGEFLMMMIVGLPLAGLPLGLTGAVLWPWWTARSHPVVPDAPVPDVRHRETQPRRRCQCHAPARCVQVTASRTNGVYSGTEYEYSCDQCGTGFTVESPLSALLALAGGGFLVALAALLWPDPFAGAGWGELAIVGGLGLLGLLSVGLAGSRVLARVRYPIVGLSPGG